MSEKKRIITYYRVSSARQVEAKSARNQVIAIEKWAENNNAEIIRAFEDEAETGRKTNRPQLNAALKYIEEQNNGTIDAFVVYKLDRAGRSVKHLCEIIEHLRKNGTAFVSVTDNIDMTTSSGRLLFYVLAAIAEFESDLISERTSAGMQRAKKEKRRTGRKKKMIKREELEEHLRNKVSIAAIARIFDVSEKTVKARMLEMGLIRSKRAEPSD